MDKEEFVDIKENVKESVKDVASRASEAVTEGTERMKNAAQDFMDNSTVLPKVETYMNDKMKNNPGLAGNLLLIGGIGNFVVAGFQFLMALLLIFASSFMSALFTSVIGSGVGQYDIDHSGMVFLHMLQNFGSAIFIVIAILFLILGGVNLWFGVKALRDRAVYGKAGFLFVAGIIQTVFSVLILLSGFTWITFICTGFSVCYLVGAYLKRQAEKKV